MCASSFRKFGLLLACASAAGVVVAAEVTIAAAESVPLPKARPAPVPVPAQKPAAPQAPPEAAAQPAPGAAAPIPRDRPEATTATPEAAPETAAPLPPAKPADTGPPVPAPRPATGEVAQPAETPEEPPSVGATEEAPDAPSDAIPADTTPRRPLFADDAMSPACAAIEEGRVSGRPLRPIEDPEGCVVPAVYAIVSLGSDRAVTLTPEAELTCAMTDRLDRFVEQVVEPAARDILGSELTGLGIAGSYVCRPRNGEPGAEPSEHGRANAVDIASFVLADGRTVTVADDWTLAPPGEPEGGETPAETVPGSSDEPPEPAATDAEATDTEATDPEASDAETPADAEPAADAEASSAERFLRAVHAAACGPFTTVIGPDGDAYHRDHFHFDLQKRGVGGETTFCQ